VPPTDQVRFRGFEQLDISERIELRVLPKFGYDKRVNPLQRGDLTIDVKHLRLEKIGTETGNDRLHYNS
jgi:hypothetical protein